MSIFNLGSGKSTIAQGMAPGKDYIIVKDGNQYEHQVLNLDNERWMPTTGIVEFSPVKTSKRHINNITLKNYRDKETGLIVGIPIQVDGRSKEIIWQTVLVRDTVIYDLSIPQQRAEAIVVSRSPFVVGSPNFRPGSKVMYKKTDKELEAQVFMKNRATKRKAEELAEGLNGQALYDMAYAIGKDPKFMSPIMTHKEVILFAEANPARFLEILNSENRQALVILKRGFATGLIEQDLNRGFTYGGVSLGFSEEEAVDFLKKNPTTMTSIDVQSRKKESATYETLTETFKKEAVVTVNEAEAKIAKLEEELARMKREKESAAAIAVELQSKEVLANEDPEFAELVAEAKKFDIRGAHFMKDKEKLRAKIEKARAAIGN